MPKFVGNDIEGATLLEDNALACGLTALTYSQAVRLPAQQIFKSVNTSDRGGPQRVAKRWYTWYANGEDIAACPRSTENMLHRAVSCAMGSHYAA